jgi:hypothetical protein
MKTENLIKLLSIATILIILSYQKTNSQVLISLLFGDNLNTGTIEFGLDGGINLANMSNTEGNLALNWNLGFYFYIDLTEKSFLHTGVLVKSPFGVNNLYPYPTGDPDVDTLMHDEGSVDRVLRYFNVPITYCYNIYDGIFLEGGFMLGLRSKGYDEFIATSDVGDEIVVRRNIKDQINPLDAGALVGAGYQFQKGLGVSLGIRYYYGFVNAHTDSFGIKHKNSNLYFFITAPIGKGKAQRKKEEKERQLREQQMNYN